jgi:hypothetical protein
MAAVRKLVGEVGEVVAAVPRLPLWTVIDVT